MLATQCSGLLQRSPTFPALQVQPAPAESCAQRPPAQSSSSRLSHGLPTALVVFRAGLSESAFGAEALEGSLRAHADFARRVVHARFAHGSGGAPASGRFDGAAQASLALLVCRADAATEAVSAAPGAGSGVRCAAKSTLTFAASRARRAERAVAARAELAAGSSDAHVALAIFALLARCILDPVAAATNEGGGGQQTR